MTNADDSADLAQRLQAIDLIEHLLLRDRPRYMALILRADPVGLVTELAYVAALLVARLADDEDSDPAALARDKEILNGLRARARLDFEE